MPSSNLASGNCEITTNAELQQRLHDRPTPAPELNLTPDRSDALTVNSEVTAQNESRIEFLRSRLERSSRDLQRDHAMSRLTGRMRTDFQRER